MSEADINTKLLAKLHATLAWPTVVSTSFVKDQVKSYDKPGSYILIVHTVQDVFQQLSDIKSNFVLNIRAYFFIVAFKTVINNRKNNICCWSNS